MTKESERLRILEKIERGEISADEGARQLAALQNAPVQPQAPSSPMDILGMVERGEITADQGVQRLHVTAGDSGQKQQRSSARPEPSQPKEDLSRYKQWWRVPLFIGLGILTLAALWMNSAYQSAGLGFWFYCSWLPFLLGVALIALAWNSRVSPWLHVRVTQPPGESPQHIAVSLPLPIRFSAWFLRNFGHRIEGLSHTNVDEVILALGTTARSGDPFYVHVDEGEDGNQVEVFIG